jgi:hypothetical protein
MMLCRRHASSLGASSSGREASPVLPLRGAASSFGPRAARLPALREQQQQQLCASPASPSHSAPSAVACRAANGGRDGKSAASTEGFKFNTVYAAIFAGYAGLFALRSPYIFAALTILTIIPQNSAVTSLNTMVLLFYESGLFMNFAEAVYCVRLLTWLSISCCLLSFAIFA